MSRAFVKETDAVEELPEKLVSEHRNLVTPEGLALIEAEVERLQDGLAEAQRASFAIGTNASVLPRFRTLRPMLPSFRSARP